MGKMIFGGHWWPAINKAIFCTPSIPFTDARIVQFPENRDLLTEGVPVFNGTTWTSCWVFKYLLQILCRDKCWRFVGDAYLLEVATNTVVMATVGGSSWHIIEAEGWQIPLWGCVPAAKTKVFIRELGFALKIFLDFGWWHDLVSFGSPHPIFRSTSLALACQILRWRTRWPFTACQDRRDDRRDAKVVVGQCSIVIDWVENHVPKSQCNSSRAEGSYYYAWFSVGIFSGRCRDFLSLEVYQRMAKNNLLHRLQQNMDFFKVSRNLSILRSEGAAARVGSKVSIPWVQGMAAQAAWWGLSTVTIVWRLSSPLMRCKSLHRNRWFRCEGKSIELCDQIYRESKVVMLVVMRINY